MDTPKGTPGLGNPISLLVEINVGVFKNGTEGATACGRPPERIYKLDPLYTTGL